MNIQTIKATVVPALPLILSVIIMIISCPHI